MNAPIDIRVGSGYDLHPLVEGRPLLLGGVHIPYPKGEAGHSDGDVVLHALTDALLGALALGDIGTHFPPDKEENKNRNSKEFLQYAVQRTTALGFQVTNADITIILERPKLKERKQDISESIAALLEIPASRISIKGKTKEGMDAVGEGKAVETYATVLLMKWKS